MPLINEQQAKKRLHSPVAAKWNQRQFVTIKSAALEQSALYHTTHTHTQLISVAIF